MDLNELKQNWNELNDQLQKNEVLNQRIIQEMIRTRSENSIDKLYRYEILGTVVVGVIFIFSIVHAMIPTPHYFAEKISFHTLFILIAISLIPTFFSQLYKISILRKLNLSCGKLNDSLRIIMKYKRYNNIERYISVPYFFTIAIYSFTLVPNPPYAILAIAFVAGIGLLLLEYIFYNRNTEKINTAIKELKEFEID